MARHPREFLYAIMSRVRGGRSLSESCSTSRTSIIPEGNAATRKTPPLKAPGPRSEPSPMNWIHDLHRPGRTTLPSAVGIPLLVLFLGFWVTDAWQQRNAFKRCQTKCEVRGAVDSTFIAENRQPHRPAECRCGFGDAEGLSWERVAFPDPGARPGKTSLERAEPDSG